MAIIKNMANNMINGFIYALILTGAVTIPGSIGMFVFELENNLNVTSYWDGLWWSFVTVSTVGYGDIVPCTLGGRITAAILMVNGLAFIEMLTSTISTYFLKN